MVFMNIISRRIKNLHKSKLSFNLEIVFLLLMSTTEIYSRNMGALMIIYRYAKKPLGESSNDYLKHHQLAVHTDLYVTHFEHSNS